MAAERADAILRGARQAAHAPADRDDRYDHQRHHDQHQSGQLGVGDDQQREAADQQKDVAQRLRQTGADHRLDHRGVAGQAREHLAGARRLEERGRQADHPIVHLLAQIGDHPLAEPRDQIGARERGCGEHHDHDQRRLEAMVRAPRSGRRRRRGRSGNALSLSMAMAMAMALALALALARPPATTPAATSTPCSPTARPPPRCGSSPARPRESEGSTRWPMTRNRPAPRSCWATSPPHWWGSPTTCSSAGVDPPAAVPEGTQPGHRGLR